MSSSLSSAFRFLACLLAGSGPQVIPPDDPAVVVARVGEVEITQGEIDDAAQEELEELWVKRWQAEAEYQRDSQRARGDALNKLALGKSAHGVSEDATSSPLPVVLLDRRFQVAAPGSPSRGTDDAPVNLVEFVDFECPFSARLAPVLKAILARYGDKVRLAVVILPLAAANESAFRAAEVALCAGEQGLFWQAHDLFLAEQKRLRQDGAEELSRELMLSRSQLRECLASGRARLATRRNQNAAMAGGVIGTPTTFLNGLYLPGALSEAKLSQHIDSELLRLGRSLPEVDERAVLSPP